MKALVSLLLALGLVASVFGEPPPKLITVTITPEARVKAAAENGAHELQQGGWREFEIVIENTAGITAPLVAECPQAMTNPTDNSRDRWLQFALRPSGPLTGQPNETRTLRLWSRDAAVRSAVLNFNAGQGTQDLGFRSDVTLTFQIAPIARTQDGAQDDRKMDGRKMKDSIFLPSIFLSSKLPASAPADKSDNFTAIVAKGVGLWPQVQTAHDGSLLAFGYNAAAHTTLPGDVDCWASTDGGKSWTLRSTAAPRPAPHANYCHFATGLAANGDALIVVSGMDHAASTDGKREPNGVAVFRSADSGKTWKQGGTFPQHLPGKLKPYPFGSIVAAPDKSLRTLAYTVDDKQTESAWMLTSRDDGRSWADACKVADGINESVLLPLAGKSWLCLARTSNRAAPEHGQELRQFRSSDDGITWTDEGLIAGYHLHPPHLLRLKDGRILLTYGNRRDGGIETRLSSDEGKTWAPTTRLFTTGPGDMGYPSTAQLPDGKLVTVFYAAKSPLHDGYHMGAVGWMPAETTKQ